MAAPISPSPTTPTIVLSGKAGADGLLVIRSSTQNTSAVTAVHDIWRSGRRVSDYGGVERRTQTTLLQDRQHRFTEFLQAILEIKPRQKDAIDAKFAQRFQLIRNIGSGPDDGIAARSNNDTRELRRPVV